MSVTKGEAAYSRYGTRRNWKTYDEKPMPKWEELLPEIQEAWEAAGEGVLAQVVVELGLDDREIAKIYHALSYKNDFSNAGVSGHTDYLLLAKLAIALGITH